MTEGFVYLVAIIDCFSGYILSCKMSISLDSDFCIAALAEVVEQQGQPEIFNTDQGGQLRSNNFIGPLAKGQIKISLGGMAGAFDNLLIERFWPALKQEKYL